MKKIGKILIPLSVVIILWVVYSIYAGAVAQLFLNDETMKKIMIVGHRGAGALAPENSMRAIECGICAGADMIEIDVHLTADNVLVVCHDNSVNRTSTGKGKIGDLTLAQIEEFRLLDTEKKPSDEVIPTLDAVLQQVNGRAKMLIEIKSMGNSYDGLEELLVECIERNNAASWCVVQSFDDKALERVHALRPEWRLEKLLVFKFFGLPVIFDGGFSCFNARKYAHVSSFNIFYPSLTSAFVNEVHKMGKEVKVYTLDNPGKRLGGEPDGVITNRPDLWK